MSILLEEILIPLVGSEDAVEPTSHLPARSDHPRFASVRAWSNSTHPLVTIGQVWEAISLDTEGFTPPRQVMVNSVLRTGMAEVVNINYNGLGSAENLGEVSQIPSVRFTESGGWMLRGLIVPVDGAGNPVPGYTLPRAVTPSSAALHAQGRIFAAPESRRVNSKLADVGAKAKPSTGSKAKKKPTSSTPTTSPTVPAAPKEAAPSKDQGSSASEQPASKPTPVSDATPLFSSAPKEVVTDKA